MFCVEFLEALPFLRTSCDLVVLIRQKLVFSTDAKIIEGLTLTRDQMTASTGSFRMGLILRSPHFIFSASPPDFKLTCWARRGKEGAFSLLMKLTDGTGHIRIYC